LSSGASLRCPTILAPLPPRVWLFSASGQFAAQGPRVWIPAMRTRVWSRKGRQTPYCNPMRGRTAVACIAPAVWRSSRCPTRCRSYQYKLGVAVVASLAQQMTLLFNYGLVSNGLDSLDELPRTVGQQCPALKSRNAKRGSDGLDKCPQMRTLVGPVADADGL
jgi:ribosomal protein L37AE/L43A